MKTNNKYREHIELWLILSFMISLGWVFGLVLTSFLLEVINPISENITTLVVAGILGGLIIGLLSMFIAWKSIKSILVWVLTTTLGWTLGLAGTMLGLQLIEGATGWLIGGAFGGLVFGILQSFGFKSDFNSRSLLWLTLNLLSWAGAYGFGYAIPADLGLVRITSINTILSKGMLGWVLFGTLSGLSLLLLFSTFKRGDRGDRVQWLP